MCMLDVDLGCYPFRFQQTTQTDRHLMSLRMTSVHVYVVKSSKGK